MAERSPIRLVRTNAAKRVLSLDVARGLMLLFIAIANLATVWAPAVDAPLAANTGGVYDDRLADKAAVFVETLLAHNRGLPMFATVLGIGFGMITASLYRRGYPVGTARRILARRYGTLAVLGVIHMVFLFLGDIMFQWGMMGLFLIALVTVRSRTLAWLAGGIFVAVALLIGLAALGTTLGAGSVLAGGELIIPDSYGAVVAVGLVILAGQVVALPLLAMYLPPVLLGVIIGRHGMLGRVGEYRRPLAGLAIVAAVVVVPFSIAWALAEIGVLGETAGAVFPVLNLAVGLIAGPGIVAALALALEPLQRRVPAGARGRDGVPAWLLPLVATGRRSMSAYVAQSALFFVLVAGFPLKLADGVGAAGQLLIALLVWGATVAGSGVLELLGRSGPLEVLLRRAAYGKRGLRPAPAQNPGPAARPAATPAGS
ncbi:DUF418 domain-containing protein [Corynebacterium otitidis]|uniref:DUF418 domain-containing protein n=1 Tax=Corynebacterium otitidis TaxID=29321 RepID=UPI000E56934B|nr:DUF418 domain-containing protein [Corynebacterium otitidis]